MSEKRESRVWGDQGVEPDPGEEVYEGQTRPIAEYDNWAMYTVTSDISTLFDWLGSVEGDLDDHEADTSTHGAEEGEHVALTPREDQAVAYDDVVNREHGIEDHDGSVASSDDLDSVETSLSDDISSVDDDLQQHKDDDSTHGAGDGEHLAVTSREDQAVEYDEVVNREHGMEDHDGSIASSDELSAVDDDLQGHKDDTENPHKTTADQVGAPTQSEFDDHRHAGETIVPAKIRLDDDVEQYIDPDSGALVIEHTPSGNTWTFDPDGSLELEKLSSNTVDAGEKNRLPKYDDLDVAPDDAGLFIAEDMGRLAYKEA